MATHKVKWISPPVGPALGSLFYTGAEVLVPGLYVSVAHYDGSTCYETLAERQVTLAKGERFPNHPNCGKRVIWRLEKYARDK